MSQKNQDIMKVGVPHIKSKIKHARNNNYNLETILPEFIDYPIENTTITSINVCVSEDKLYSLTVSDNCVNGFENILEADEKNPFNWGHERDDHIKDDVISEYGTGLKQALAACGGKVTIYTKIPNGECYMIVFDFYEMSRRPTPFESYMPTIFEKISDNDYKHHHKFDIGSTILVEEIRPEIYHTTTEDEIVEKIKQIIKKTYNKLLIKKQNTLQIYINDCLVTHETEFFDRFECRPFNISRNIIIKRGDKMEVILIEKEKICDTKLKFRYYNKTTKKWNIIKTKTDIDMYLKLPNYYPSGYMNDDNETMMILKGTGIMFINNLHEHELPKGKTNIYKIDRNHGYYADINNSNGSKNYVYIELHLKSKSLGKDLGATYKKTIDLNKTNDITDQLKANIKDLSSLLEYDTSTNKAKKHYNTAKEHGINIAENKIPSSFKGLSTHYNNFSSDIEEEVTLNESPHSNEEEEEVTVNESPPSDEEEEVTVNESPPSDEEEEEVTVNESPHSNEEEVTLNESPHSNEEEVTVNESPPSDEEEEVTLNESPPSDEEEVVITISSLEKFNNQINSIKTKADVFEALNKMVNNINIDTDKKKQIENSDIEIDQTAISYIKYINELINN